MYTRDPLSTRYDGVVRDVMARAARAQRQRQSVQVWVASPRGEYRGRDRGGRTAHERAFTRSAYYLIFRTPIRNGHPPEWSLKITWGGDTDRKESSGGRLARPAQVRLYRRDQAKVGRGGRAAGRRGIGGGGPHGTWGVVQGDHEGHPLALGYPPSLGCDYHAHTSHRIPAPKLKGHPVSSVSWSPYRGCLQAALEGAPHDDVTSAHG